MNLKEIEQKIDKVTNGKLYTTQELLDEFDAKYVANGVYRAVYSIPGDNKHVLKIEHRNGKFDRSPHFMNIAEYLNWCNLKFRPYQK